jgi:hypothetical protein
MQRLDYRPMGLDVFNRFLNFSEYMLEVGHVPVSEPDGRNPKQIPSSAEPDVGKLN